MATARRSSAAGADTEEAVVEPVKEHNGEVKEQGNNPIYLRSAGLSEKPTGPKEEQGRKNAQEAFPDMQPAPLQAQADTLAQNTGLAERRTSPVPPVAVTQPSLDVPAPVPVPGTADLLAFPFAEPTEAAEADSGRLSPISPSTPTKGKEGLSRPTSPSAEAGLLRAPPTRDDDSPPPPPLIELSARKSLSPAQKRAPHAPSSTASSSLTNLRTSSPAPSRSAHPSGRLTSPTASSLAKARPRVSSTTTSPTRSRPTSSAGATTSVSSSAPRRPANATPPSVSAPRISPHNSRASLTPSTDPRRSPAVGRQRSGSIGSTTSRETAMTGSARGATPGKAVPTSGTPRSRKAAEKISPTASRETAPKEHAATSTPTRTPATPSSSSIPTRGSPALRRPAGRGRIGLAGARMNRGGNHAVGGRKDKEGEAEPSVQQPEAKEEPGEVALEGQAQVEQVEQVEEAGPSSSTCTAEQPPSSSSPVSAPALGPSSAPVALSDASSSPSVPADDDIPVFKGFGSRPHGRIPIPMEKKVNPETGEEEMVAKQPRETELEGEGAEQDGKGHGGEGEEKRD
ncbi:hypothetical protein JCM5296_005578 [Sporobolomyces johnsonii]